MKQALVVAALAAAAGIAGLQGCATTQASAQSEVRKVVFQVSDRDPAKWGLVLNNARNVQADLGKENVQVEIVAYGPGLDMLKFDSKVSGRLGQAMNDKVTLLACENTMRNTKTTRAQMYPGIAYVDAGVTHLMQRQREGWSYVRP